MTVSQLIEALELAKNYYGDLEVITLDHFGAAGEELYLHVSGVAPYPPNGIVYLQIVDSGNEI